jgi:exosortase/archaeosortase family protein
LPELSASLPGAAAADPPSGRSGKLARPVLLVLACAGAAWPMLPWLRGRWFATGASPLPALAMGVALAAWVRMLLGTRADRAPGRPRTAPLWLSAAAACLTLYAGAYHFVPRLVSSELALLALGFLMAGALPAAGRRRAWGLVALVALAAPAGPSLQYVFGYPLRVVSGKLAALLLGTRIHTVGTGLSDGVHTVFVDGPCSGVRMLTVALTLAAGAALFRGLSFLRTALLLFIALALAVVGNGLRTATLFIVETRSMGRMVHEATGLVVFAGCAALLVWIASRLGRKSKKEQPPSPDAETRPRPEESRARWAAVPFCASLALAAVIPLLTPGARAAEGTAVPVRWPAAWQGRKLVRVRLDEASRRFGRDFPGATARFRVAGTSRTVLLRYTTRATRKLHPAEDCYRGVGWKVEPLPALVDGRGRTWSRFAVTRDDGTTSAVRQCYFAVAPPEGAAPRELERWLSGARSWPDASSWYWRAARPGSGVRATLAITVCEDH